MTYNRTITYRGETFGSGTDIGVVALRGLESLDVDLLTPDLPRYHGGLVGASYSKPRTLELELMVRPSNRQRALSAFQPEVHTENELTIVWDDENEVDLGNRLVFCRPARRGGPSRDRSTEFAAHTLTIELIASDPAIYDDTLDSAALSVFAAAAGLSYPVMYPKIYGAAGSGSGTTVVNEGDWESWPTFKINGPTSGTLTNPIIENTTTGLKLEFTANGGVSVAAGQQLIIKTHPKDRSVLFASGASRYGRLSTASDWFPLEPGNNELRFRASGSTTGANAVVEHRSAWI